MPKGFYGHKLNTLYCRYNHDRNNQLTKENTSIKEGKEYLSVLSLIRFNRPKTHNKLS